MSETKSCHVAHVTCNENEINLLDYYHVIKKHKKMIAGIVALSLIAGVIISLFLPKYFKAEAVIIPVSSKGGGSSLSSLASQFGGLASLAGVSVPGGTGETEKIVIILKSRTLTENVITDLNLMPVLFKDAWDSKNNKWKTDDPKQQPDMESAVNALRGAVSVMDDKKNKSIKISSVSLDPELSARIANAYLDELQKFINSNALTMAKRNRIFIEGQLEQNKRDLLEAGREINEFYKTNRVSSIEAKVDVPLNNDNLTFTNHPNAGAGAGQLPVTDIDELLAQKADIEQKLASVKIVENVPQQVYLSYLMLRRELLGKMNALLTAQYENAKIDESKEDLAFQIIDKAVPPMRKFKPKRAQICIMSFMASLFAAVFLAFFREYLERMKHATRDK